MTKIDSFDPPAMNPQRRPGPPPASVGGLLRRALRDVWRTLRTMRTALWLLGVLAIESVVATIVPQWPNVPATVRSWRDGSEGPGVAVSRVLDAVGAFDVYASPLFLGTLLLLFTSLTACLLPRVRAWWRISRHSVPPLTRHLGSQDHVARLVTDAAPAHAHAAVRGVLVDRRWRTRDGRLDGRAIDPAEPDGVLDGDGSQLAAERGQVAREGGSLVFHLSFYVLLVAIVLGQLLTYEGFAQVVEGEAFTDTPIGYGISNPGRWFEPDDHTGFTLTVEEFTVDWIRDPLDPAAGTPTVFEADVSVVRADGSTAEATVAGNRPLVVDGAKIHLLGWGYAARVVVREGDVVVHDGYASMVFSEEEGAFTGVIKAPAAEPDIGLELVLVPFAPDGEDGVPQLTGAPWADEPLLVFTPWAGDLNLDQPQPADQLDTSAMASGFQDFSRVGEVAPIGGGRTVEFAELRQWTNLQVTQRPQVPWLLLGASLLLVGLVPALYAYRRRLWVAFERRPDGRTLVTVAGRAFQRPEAYDEEFAELTERIARTLDATPVADPVSPDLDATPPAAAATSVVGQTEGDDR